MRKLILTLSAVFVLILHAAAQDRTITGKVTNDKGAPIEGASITSNDGKYGTQTDKFGTYSLSVPPTVKSLNFSNVNFEGESKTVGKNTVINVSLRVKDSKLEEVVVVGYGVQQKKAFTGSATRVDVKEFANLLTPSIDRQLAGRAPGVQVTIAGGLVNTPAVIRIRGVQSINLNNNPLIVVDGAPMLTGGGSSLNIALATNSNLLGDINPADIESIDVLKDGSATAIYGSRASNGVILITTKKGTRGRSRITYEGFVGFSSPMNRFRLLDAPQFETIANEKLTNAALAPRAGVNASADTANTDWQSLVMNNNATSQSHTISYSGGTDKSTFYFSLGYSDQKGIVLSNYNRAYRIRMNLEHEANKYIRVGNNLSISRQEDGDQNNGANSLGGAIASTLRLLPNVSPYATQGWEGYNITYAPIGGTNSMFIGPNSQSVDDNFFNVLYTMRRSKVYSDKYRITDVGFVELMPAKGLRIKSQAAVDMFNDYSYQGLNLFHGDGYSTGSVFNGDLNILRLVWTNTVNYNKSIRNHNFFVTVGHEAQTERTKSISGTGSTISDPFFIAENYISGSAGVQTIAGGYDVRQGFLSVFSRFNYDYKNRYFFQASIRRDGQAALAPGNKWGSFPGFSVGWRPSEERFWKSKKITELKLKASYAKVGNTLDQYRYLSQFGPRNYGNLGGIAPTVIGNPKLVWESSAKYDIGIEVGLLKSRINFTADWFLNDVNNLILDVPYPPSVGFPGSTTQDGGSITENVGKLQNRGLELGLNAGIIRHKNFSWDFNINFTDIRNKVTKLYDVGGQPALTLSGGSYNLTKVGEPINYLWGYQSAGVNAASGNPMFYKADGSMVQLNLNRAFGTGTIGNFYYALDKNDPNLGVQTNLSSADKVKLGNAQPTFFGAFTNSFQYKGFGMDVMFRYSGGNRIMNFTAQEVLFNQSFQNNGAVILDRWTKPGQVTDVPKLYYGQAANINQTGSATSRFVEKGDYIRLQNVVLSYTFDPALVDKRTKGYLKSAKFYVQGQNLYVWTKYSGADPDNISTTGVDAAVSPQVRNISMGFSFGF